MREPTRVEVCSAVAKQLREAGDIVDATAVLIEFYDYVKNAGYKQGRDDEAHALYHGAGVRI